MKTFNEHWNETYTPGNMPGIFEVAMRELAMKAWNAALDSASTIANTTSNQNQIMSKIDDLIV